MDCDCDYDEFQGEDHEHLSDDEFTSEESTDSWKLKKIVTLDGTHVAEDFCISGREMIDYGALDGAKADKEEYPGWNYDTGTQTTLWYRRSNRTTFTVHCIDQGSMTTAECVNDWLDPVKAEPDNEARREELLKFSLALLDTMQKDLENSTNGGRQSSPFGPPQKFALIVCFAWLGMPEMCEEALKFTHCPSLKYLWWQLRAPIRQSGGIMRYRSFVTEAVTDMDDFAQVCNVLLALVGPPLVGYVFRGSERRRRHVKTELRAVHGNALSLKTENTGTPYARVINKTLDHMYRDERQAWEARVREAKQQLRQCSHLIQGGILGPSFFTALPQDAMQQILGEFIVPPAAIELSASAPAPATDTDLMMVPGNAPSADPAKRQASDELVDPTVRKRLVGSEGLE